MDSSFSESLPILSRLAREAARTTPPLDANAFTYIDQGFSIFGHTFDAFDQRLERHFLHQQQFITAQFKNIEEDVDKRFQKIENLIIEQSNKVNQSLDDQRKRNLDTNAWLQNAAAIESNRHLHRMHHIITPITVHKPNNHLDKSS
ncbi:hypothetical protein MMC22_003073 [Lobaria immixta]|nr:hypothetical protein [Lobaria immixta]